TTTSSPTRKMSDLTIWPTVTPMARAASSAVRVPSGNSRTATSRPRTAAASTTARALRCRPAVPGAGGGVEGSTHPRCHTGPMRHWLVGGGLVLGDRGLLLGRHRRRNGAHDWSPPGGVIDEGETLIEGLTREVAEETGVVVSRWQGPVYEVEVDAPGLGWHLRVEAHLALETAGEVRVADPDGI